MDISHQLMTAPDGLTLRTITWQGDVSNRGLVIVVHGYAEYAGRYHHVAADLTAAGYTVCGIDHRGHGESQGERVYFPAFKTPVQDLALFIEKMRATHQPEKWFIFGHSMGTLLTLKYLLDYQPPIDGVILSGTAVNLDELAPEPIIRLAGVVARFAPRLRFIPPLSSDTLSTNPKTIAAYDSDPLIDRGVMRGSLLHAMIQTGREIRERIQTITVPLLMLHGEDDTVTPVSGSHFVYEHATSDDKSLHIFSGMRHEIVNELEKDRVLAIIQQWLNNH